MKREHALEAALRELIWLADNNTGINANDEPTQARRRRARMAWDAARAALVIPPDAAPMTDDDLMIRALHAANVSWREKARRTDGKRGYIYETLARRAAAAIAKGGG